MEVWCNRMDPPPNSRFLLPRLIAGEIDATDLDITMPPKAE